MDVIRLVFLSLCLTLSSLLAAAQYSDATAGESKVSVVVIDDYQAVLELFDQLNYTDKSWLSGERAVPRIYLSVVPPQWGKSVSKEIDVTLKKRLFFRAIGPMVLRSNELIAADRQRLKVLDSQLLKKPDSLSGEDQAWLQALARDYRLAEFRGTGQELVAALLMRVDTIPPSLILAQAAEESGWGTSRFAFAGNALFGQWTWGGEGITPKSQRSGMGNYKIAAFASPLLSVQAHALNLNTHNAYEKFRQLRANKRAAGKKFTGLEAAGTLDKYSERGLDYVKSLRSIISYNKLQGTDEAFFADMHAIVLVPGNQSP